MENKNVKQTGLLYKYNPTDFRVGASPLVYPVINLSGDWREWRPADERQFKEYGFDTLSCATFSALNVLETTVNFFISNSSLTLDKLEWLNKNGYIVDGKLNLSDRFTAIMSGTTDKGNYMDKVWDSIRKDGVIPEADFPFGGNNQAEYLDASLITQAMKEKAIKFLDIVEIYYEWGVNSPEQIVNYLKECSPHIAIYNASHAVQMIEKGYMYDTYPPFLGLLPKVDYVLRPLIRVKTARTLKFGMYGDDVKALQEDLKTLGYFVYPTTTRYFGNVTLGAVKALQKSNGIKAEGIVGPITRAKIEELKKQPSLTMIEKWALAIQKHEGYFEGSRSFRNNNPANFKIGTKLTNYMISLGATGVDKDGFVIFPNKTIGFNALCMFLEDACKNRLRPYRGNMTLFRFFEVYAPSSDNNNPAEYALAVAKAIGVPPETTISSLIPKVGTLSDQFSNNTMSNLFRTTKEDFKGALVSAGFMALIAIFAYIKELGSIWDINWRDLLNVGILAGVVGFISISKNFLTTVKGNFVGLVKIK